MLSNACHVLSECNAWFRHLPCLFVNCTQVHDFYHVIVARAQPRSRTYTHSTNGGALGKPGPNSVRTRLVSPLARRKIKYGHIYKFCNKANGGRHSGCIPGGEVALAAKNWQVKILAYMLRWFLQRTQNKGRIREKVGVLLIRADCVQFSKRKLTPWRFFPSHKLPKLCTLKCLIKRLFYLVGCYLWN